MKPQLTCFILTAIGFASIRACNGSDDYSQIRSDESVYEHMYETTSADMANSSKPFNLTEQRIKATPEYKYRMIVILTLQLYWAQSDHAVLTRSKHERFYVAKDLEIPHMNDALNETHMYVESKWMPIKDLYQEIYNEKITWTEKMTKVPIEQETIDELVRRWNRIEQMFEEHNRREKIPKDVPPHEIEAMGSGIKLAVEELILQYKTIKKRMKRVLQIIDEMKIEVFPDMTTEHPFDQPFLELLGEKYSDIKATENSSAAVSSSTPIEESS